MIHHRQGRALMRRVRWNVAAIALGLSACGEAPAPGDDPRAEMTRNASPR